MLMTLLYLHLLLLAMRKMLLICEEYASKYCVLFNASKSKCVICVSRQKSMCDYLLNIKFTLTGKVIETVKSWPHFGHIITSNMDDVCDVSRCQHKLIGQDNDVLCTLRHVDSMLNIDLLKNYCLSLYGCEL